MIYLYLYVRTYNYDKHLMVVLLLLSHTEAYVLMHSEQA